MLAPLGPSGNPPHNHRPERHHPENAGLHQTVMNPGRLQDEARAALTRTRNETPHAQGINPSAKTGDEEDGYPANRGSTDFTRLVKTREPRNPEEPRD